MECRSQHQLEHTIINYDILLICIRLAPCLLLQSLIHSFSLQDLYSLFTFFLFLIHTLHLSPSLSACFTLQNVPFKHPAPAKQKEWTTQLVSSETEQSVETLPQVTETCSTPSDNLLTPSAQLLPPVPPHHLPLLLVVTLIVHVFLSPLPNASNDGPHQSILQTDLSPTHRAHNNPRYEKYFPPHRQNPLEMDLNLLQIHNYIPLENHRNGQTHLTTLFILIVLPPHSKSPSHQNYSTFIPGLHLPHINLLLHNRRRSWLLNNSTRQSW